MQVIVPIRLRNPVSTQYIRENDPSSSPEYLDSGVVEWFLGTAPARAAVVLTAYPVRGAVRLCREADRYVQARSAFVRAVLGIPEGSRCPERFPVSYALLQDMDRVCPGPVYISMAAS